MKRIILLMLFMATAMMSFAQDPNDEVTLTVTFDGVTKEEATNNALRNALEQAYKVFVSSDTKILNDELVKDEIVSITQGNIKEYKEIASIDLPNGRKEVTIQATVSIPKLVSYAQSKGASTEIAGATFAKNMKMRSLNKENEALAMAHALQYIKLSLPSCYDRKLTMGEPTMFGDILNPYDRYGNGDYVSIPVKIEYVPNGNLELVIDAFEKTVQAMSLTKEEIKEYKKINEPFFGFYFASEDNRLLNEMTVDYDETKYAYWLRNRYDDWRDLFDDYFLNFSIKDNTGQVSKYVGTWHIDPRKFHWGTGDMDYVENKETTGVFAGLLVEEGAYHQKQSVYVTDVPRSTTCFLYLTVNDKKTKNKKTKSEKKAIEFLWAMMNQNTDQITAVYDNSVFMEATEFFWERKMGYPFSTRLESFLGEDSSPSNNPVQGKKQQIIPTVKFTLLIPSQDINKYSNFELVGK